MNRNFIFTFILLATLSTVYAVPHQLRSLLPTLCPANSSSFTLSVTPNSINSGTSFTFNVSGKLNSEIPTGTIFNAAFFNDDNNFGIIASFSEDFCTSQGISCPNSAGTEFSTGIQKSAPGNLPKSFGIGAVLISQRDSTVIACTFIKGSGSQ